jgi:hypothetical protein
VSIVLKAVDCCHDALCHGLSVPGCIPRARDATSCRRLALRLFRQPRWRRRVILFLTLAVLFAGIAQAAHSRKSDLVQGSTHVHCLLCLFAASSASPAALARVIPSRAPRFCSYRCLATSVGAVNSDGMLYDARGPPAA